MSVTRIATVRDTSTRLLLSALALVGGILHADPEVGGVNAEAQPVRLAGCKTCAVLVRNSAKEAGDRLAVGVEVNPCGNKIGAKLLLEGKADIGIFCQHPRDLGKRFEFIADAVARLHASPFAMDGYCLMVHPNNPVDNISFGDLAKVYRGEVSNWKELGGKDIPIWAYRHDPELGSGLAMFFQERTIGLKASFSPRVVVVQSPRVTAEYVLRHENAFGYASLSDVPPGVKKIAVDGQYVTREAIAKGDCPFSVTYYFVTVGPPAGAAKQLVDFYLGEKGRELLSRYCIIPKAGGE